MNTRLLIRTRTEVIIKRFLLVNQNLAFELQSGQINVGETILLRFFDSTEFVFIVSEQDGIFVTATVWTGPLPDVARISNILIENLGDGTVDPGFQTGSGFNSSVNQCAEDFQNRLICGGAFTQYKGQTGVTRIARILSNGDLDATFNVGTGFNEEPRTIEPLPNGSVLIGGRFTQYNGQTANHLVLLNEDGSRNFGFDIGSGFQGGVFPYVYDIERINDNFLIVGNFITYKGVTYSGIVLLDEDGDAVTSFNTGTGFGATAADRAYCAFYDEDEEKIYVGGNFTQYNGTSRNRIVRLNLDGSIDSTFSIGSGFNSTVLGIKKWNGKIVCFGIFSLYNGTSCTGLIFLNTDGSIEQIFQFQPTTVTSFIPFANGQFMVAGSYDQIGTPPNQVFQSKIARLNLDGTVDTDFQSGFTLFVGADVRAIRQENGKIVVFGSFTQYFSQTQNRILRLAGGYKSLLNDFQELDLKEDLQFPLNYNIADISKPESRKSSFSKTIELPGTDRNGQILTQLYEIDADHVYNVNLKRGVIVLQDNLEIFRGTMRVDSIKRNNWNTISYEVSLNGETSNIFDSLKNDSGTDLLLSDLNLSEYNHPFNRQSIVDSWKGQIIQNGLPYSNINTSSVFSVTDTEFADGNNTAFVVGDSTGIEVGDTVFFVADDTTLFPASLGHHTVIGVLSDRVIVNLEFQSSATNSGDLTVWTPTGEGYVYPSIYLGGTGPGGTANIRDLEVTDFKPFVFAKTYVDKIFEATGFSYESQFFESDFFKRLIVDSVSNFTNVASIGLTPFVTPTTSNAAIPILFDNEISDVNGLWNSSTLVYTNTSQLTPLSISFNIDFSNIVVGGGFGTTLALRIFRSLNPAGNALDPTWSTGLGNDLDDIGNQMAYGILNSGVAGLGTTFTGPSTINFNRTISVLQLRPGEEIRFLLSYIPGAPGVSINADSGLLRIEANKPLVNDKITAREFLVNLIRMFNLQIEPVQGNDRRLIIEPYDEYFIPEFVDWTNRVDVSREIEIIPISNFAAKTYTFNYTDDSDFLNTDFKRQTAQTYGFFDRLIDNDFVTGTRATKISFAPTPFFDPENLGRIIIPAIFRDANLQRSQQNRMRILYWTGVRPAFGDYEIAGVDTDNDFQVDMYGQAGHMDNPLNATLDLNFSEQPFYYYGNSYFFKTAQRDLYFEYYRNFIDEITAVESRIVRMWMKLSSYDITTLSFRKIYWIKGVAYKLQKIQDYNPLTSSPILCEFVKARPVLPIVSTGLYDGSEIGPTAPSGPSGDT